MPVETLNDSRIAGMTCCVWTHAASRETSWFWTSTARTPQAPTDRGYAASRETAMAALKAAWERE